MRGGARPAVSQKPPGVEGLALPPLPGTVSHLPKPTTQARLTRGDVGTHREARARCRVRARGQTDTTLSGARCREEDKVPRPAMTACLQKAVLPRRNGAEGLTRHREGERRITMGRGSSVTEGENQTQRKELPRRAAKSRCAFSWSCGCPVKRGREELRAASPGCTGPRPRSGWGGPWRMWPDCPEDRTSTEPRVFVKEQPRPAPNHWGEGTGFLREPVTLTRRTLGQAEAPSPLPRTPSSRRRQRLTPRSRQVPPLLRFP